MTTPVVIVDVEDTPKVRVKPKEPFEMDELVTVLHGYGRVRANERHYIDNTLFVNGIAHNIAYRVARKWKLDQPHMVLYILANDADEAEYAQVAGIQLMTPEKVATMLVSSDLDAIFAALGEDRTITLVRGLGQRLGTKFTDDVPPPPTRKR